MATPYKIKTVDDELTLVVGIDPETDAVIPVRSILSTSEQPGGDELVDLTVLFTNDLAPEGYESVCLLGLTKAQASEVHCLLASRQEFEAEQLAHIEQQEGAALPADAFMAVVGKWMITKRWVCRLNLVSGVRMDRDLGGTFTVAISQVHGRAPYLLHQLTAGQAQAVVDAVVAA